MVLEVMEGKQVWMTVDVDGNYSSHLALNSFLDPMYRGRKPSAHVAWHFRRFSQGYQHSRLIYSEYEIGLDDLDSPPGEWALPFLPTISMHFGAYVRFRAPQRSHSADWESYA